MVEICENRSRLSKIKAKNSSMMKKLKQKLINKMDQVFEETVTIVKEVNTKENTEEDLGQPEMKKIESE
jgi:hypothetical protein